MRRLVAVLFLGLAPLPVQAELVRLDIKDRSPFAGGKVFGDVGAYEMLRGVAHYALDPADPRNKVIVDLDLAPRNKDGKVEFASEFCILVPKDPAKGNGAAFYDVNNRGGKLALRFFNFAPGGNDLAKKGSEGDGFLMRQGYTVVWCGWIGEMWPGDDRLLLSAPPVLEKGKPVRGSARFEMSSDTKVDSLPLSRRENHATYVLVPGAKATLTVRNRVDGPRKEVPASKWSLTTTEVDSPLDPKRKIIQQRVVLKGGFEPGKLYELIGEVEGAFVQGTGFAAVRDLISFLKNDASEQNPCRAASGKPVLNRAQAFGVSQSGRFLRHLLYLGMNEDEMGRIVFDGLMPHVAGGGLGFFNHRFAQPTRHNGQHEDHTYPADMFPFTYGPDVDPFTMREDSILGRYEKSKKQPKIMHTQSAAEYWHRAGSLVHTDAAGTKDAEIPANVRIYAFGGTQHGPASDPPSRGNADNLANPADYRPFLRGLLVALDHWVKDNKTPPPSVYPLLSEKSLVHWDRKSSGFPNLPGVRFPNVIQAPAYCDHGPDFATTGILSVHPPKVIGHYKVFVPRSDSDGNDLGTLLVPDVAVPLATYTGWNLRRKNIGADGQLASLLGSYIPFAKTKAERERTKDPRAAISERYKSLEDYLERYAAVCRALSDQGYLLEEDAARLRKQAAERKGLFVP